jgi:alanyl-tRNA synthetase
MLTSAEIRQKYLDFFASKVHTIVPSAPIVVKNDPTLMFTNAGMNQFKDYFLGNQQAPYSRAADTQKCLRVSGKHNDLEEVGVDTYHHTMFEMLGNWSFGDPAQSLAGYFKKEAIAWSWELLTEVYGLQKDRLYVTIFEGDTKENIPKDEEAFSEWKKVIAEDRILLGNKKDNFWEMGDTGPCGPCTEIHVDMRSDEERKKIDGATLVNNDDPQVIEIWNNVFIQFNRKKDGSLEPLPAKHVDTGMGFERLVRAIQGKSSNYDTDVFTNTIAAVEKIVNKKYDFSDSKESVSFRVIADHIRAISFTIADGQLPSNTGAGYVIRRILRRAVRYYYSYLNYKQPLLTQLVPVLAKQFENVFPELFAQQDFVAKVIKEEEEAFLRTVDKGLKLFYNLTNAPITSLHAESKEEFINQMILKDSYSNIIKQKIIPGEFAFKLSDTYGFPIDLTNLLASEEGWKVDMQGYEDFLFEQKNRSRSAAEVDTEDWVEVNAVDKTSFVGYTETEIKTKIVKYRKVTAKGKTQYQIVLEQTPFYAESGGQVGDQGKLIINNEELIITSTKRENDMFVHFTDSILSNLQGEVIASIDTSNRRKIQRHHTATHLLQAALQQVLGKHIAQKGSLNNADALRFDFSHFAKVSDEEVAQVEKIVNQKIRQNIPVVIKEMSKDEAMQLGAMALFGEKYGDTVRVVIIDPNFSIELCGGTHVGATGELGIFKITSESAIAAGVRRIEAVAGCKAEAYINAELQTLKAVKEIFKNPKDLNKTIADLIDAKAELIKTKEQLEKLQSIATIDRLILKKENINGIDFYHDIILDVEANLLKKIHVELEIKSIEQSAVLLLFARTKEKISILLACSDSHTEYDCGKLIKEKIGPLINGSGGGQKFLAMANGTENSKLESVIKLVKESLV